MALVNTHKKDLCTTTHLKRIKTKFVLIIIICTNNNNNNNDDEALYVVPISVSVLTSSLFALRAAHVHEAWSEGWN